MPWTQDLLVSDQFQQDSRIMIQNDPAMVRSCVPKRLEPAFLGNKETSTLLNQKHPLFFVLRWCERTSVPLWIYECLLVQVLQGSSSVSELGTRPPRTSPISPELSRFVGVTQDEKFRSKVQKGVPVGRLAKVGTIQSISQWSQWKCSHDFPCIIV
jgi:hypothetical protein